MEIDGSAAYHVIDGSAVYFSREWHADTQRRNGTPVSVSSGGTVTIDAGLDPGAGIQGQITEDDGSVAVSGTVSLYSTSGTLLRTALVTPPGTVAPDGLSISQRC